MYIKFKNSDEKYKVSVACDGIIASVTFLENEPVLCENGFIMYDEEIDKDGKVKEKEISNFSKFITIFNHGSDFCQYSIDGSVYD